MIEKKEKFSSFNVFCRDMDAAKRRGECEDFKERAFVELGLNVTSIKEMMSFANECNINDKWLDDNHDNLIKQTEKTKKIQFTYIMKDCNNGLYKIGKSIDPKYREKTLQSEKPSIKMVKQFNVDIEKQLHKEFKNNRVRGEWFNLSKIQVNHICTRNL